MGIVIQSLVVLLLLHLLGTSVEGGNHDKEYYCKPTIRRCCDLCPIVKFPFRLKNSNHYHLHHHQQQQQPHDDDDDQYCAYPDPGFELSCSENGTVLELPHSVKVVVKEIDYESQSIHTIDPQNCFPRLFFRNLVDLSLSPFRLASDYVYDYSFFNCPSTTPNHGFNFIPCLSSSGGGGGPNQNVYAVNSHSFMYSATPLNCEKMFNISSIPYQLIEFQQSELTLSWSKPACGICERQNRLCRLKKNKSSIGHETECFNVAEPHLTTGPQ